MRTATGQITVLLADLQKRDATAPSRILPIVYKELRRLAAHCMRDERAGQTIQPTELVHEAYLRLVGQERMEWQGRNQFFAMAAASMRRILVERARRKLAEKHGGGGGNVELEGSLVFSLEKSKDMVALGESCPPRPLRTYSRS